MEIGDVFKHPVEGRLGMIELIAERRVKGCDECIFGDKPASCYSKKIGIRVTSATGKCSDDDVIYKIHRGGPEREYDLKEVLVDIAYEVGARGYGAEGDSRSLVKDIISWADEFMRIHENTNWGETNYMETVYDYVTEKINKEYE